MECDFQCLPPWPVPHPEGGLRPFCCASCLTTQAKHVTDKNRELWSDKTGFWTSAGCALPREQMPEECVNYDCKQYEFSARYRWDSEEEKWEMVGFVSYPIKKCTDEIMTEYFQALKKLGNLNI